MLLTPERESELVESNMQKVYRAVDNFTARCEKNVLRIPYDDFVQEGCLAYLTYLRRCKSEEGLDVFPWYDVLNALDRYVLACQPMTGSTRTSSFDEIVRSMPLTVSYEANMTAAAEVDGMSRHWVDDKDTMMDLELFLDSLPDYADRIFAMKLSGLSSRKIAAQLGVTESLICKRLKNYREKYDAFTKEEEENAKSVS